MRLITVIIAALYLTVNNDVQAVDEVRTMQDIEGAITITQKAKKCRKKNKAKAGDILYVSYTGSIDERSEAGEKGFVFEDKIEKFAFQIGTTAVIAGWDQGLIGMCVGEKRTLVIPPSLGYGEHATGDHVPGGATLKYDLELIKIEEAPKEQKQNVFMMIDVNNDAELTRDELQTFFQEQKQMDMPEEVMGDDMNGDDIIQWQEFGGPKGDAHPMTGEKDQYDQMHSTGDGAEDPDDDGVEAVEEVHEEL